MADRGLIRDVVNHGLKLEHVNVELVRKNLAAARNKLKKDLEKDPTLLGSARFIEVLDQYLEELNEQIPAQFETEKIYKEGIREGKSFLGDSARIPADSDYWGWTPQIPIGAIGLVESEMADLIQKTTKELKDKTLRAVQVGIASGEGIGDIQDAILGLGISGLRGKDGIWRTATNRAEMQARTVVNSVINKGAMLTYGQVADTCPELEIKKVWQTVSDGRTSERCTSLNGQIRELNEDFIAGDGWKGSQPPSHPSCRSRVTTLSKRYQKEYDQRFTATEPKQSPKPPKVNLSDNPRKATAPKINPALPRLSKNDAVFSNPNYSLEGFNDAIGNLAKQDPELGVRLKDLANFQKKNNIAALFHDDNYVKGQKERFITALEERIGDNKYGSPIGPISLGKNLVIDNPDMWGFTGEFLPHVMLRTDGLNGEPFNFDIKTIKENYRDLRTHNNLLRVSRNFNPNMTKAQFQSMLKGNTTLTNKGEYDQQLLVINTYVHELGHQVQYKSKAFKLPKGFHYSELPTSYAGYNAKEAFAESFTQYMFDPDGLKTNSPNLFRWVDKAWRSVK